MPSSAIRHAGSERTGFFATLSEAEINSVEEHSFRAEFLPGDLITTPDDSVMVIVEGRVSCEIIDLAGNPFLLATGGVGEVFGELGFFSDERPNDEKVAVRAERRTVGIVIDSRVFRQIITQNPAVLRFLLQQNVTRLLNMNRFAINAVQVGADPERREEVRWSDRIAGIVTKHIGTWYCVAGFMLGIVVWMLGNALFVRNAIDPYPYIFLNLILSSISALTMPVILMSQNRQSQADRHAFRATQLLLKGLQDELSSLNSRVKRDSASGFSAESDR